MLDKKGVTLIELIAILVILGIIAATATFLIGNTVGNARLLADQQLISNINSAISYYDANNPDNLISESSLSDEEIFTLLVSEGYLSNTPSLSSVDSELDWDEDTETFRLNVGGEVLPLSPYGDTFEQIVPEIIGDMQEYFINNGTYARTWGDYRYTDIGLDPEDWDGYILNIKYKPSGSDLRLDIEDGYQFVVEKIDGTEIEIDSDLNWSLIYSDLDEKWYYHSVDPTKEIDIDTLTVELS
jgi:type II secretory pathway pseudopilin PulG